MHGQFYSQQHYLPQQGRVATPQNAGSNRNLNDLGQQSHLSAHYVNQHAAAAVNGQGFQAHMPQQRIQQLPHHPSLTQYNQLLGHNYQTLYNPALQNQAQQLQATHHQVSQQAQQQQVLLQRQQQSAQEAANLRTLLASNPFRMQSALFNQLGINHTAAQHASNNLLLSEHVPATSKTPAPQMTRVQVNEQQQARVNLLRDTPNQRVTAQGLAPPLRTVRIPNAHPQSSAAQTLTGQDILRHLSPNAHPRIPTTFHQNVSPNMFQNLLLSPEIQTPTGIISPHRSAYSPSVSHLGHIPPTRIQTPHQMSRSEITSVQDQYSGNYVPNARQSTTPRQELQSPPQKPTSSGTIMNPNACVKRQTPSVNSCSTAVLIISDSEDDDDNQPQQQEQQNETANTEGKSESPPTEFARVVIDDDIEITGVKQAEIMSHMRADCPIHPFKKIDVVDVGPQEQNALRCAKCYCYVCDKLALGCASWTIPTFPHCNAHSRASCWKARRNTKKSPLMSRLSPEDVTQEIERAGEIAMQYMIKIREVYITYRAGTPCEYTSVPCNCVCHRSSRPHDPCMHCKAVHDQKKKFNYEPVREVALGLIREIQQKYSSTQPASALVMLEAVLSELCAHRPADFNHNTRMPSNPDTRCQCNTPHIMEHFIEKEMIDILSRSEVSKTFRNSLVKCIEDAIKPLQLKDVMKKFLGMRHWDDLLLRAVLSGSNVTGSKSRDILRETADVVKMRVEKLDQEKRYQSIIRYLKAVKVYQGTKATISGVQFDVLLEQWMMYYTAKQGHFKDVVLRMTEQKTGSPVCTLATMPPDFLIKLLDALAGVDVFPDTRLDSFDSTSARGLYSISGKDADVLLLVFEFILDQNRAAGNHVPCYLWLAKWVNRTPLHPCVDPNMIRLWVGQATMILEQAQQASGRKQWQSLLMQCNVHDPHVHLFTASMNILSAVNKLRSQFHSAHIQTIIDCYKNNEWALFHLLTQSGLMNFGDTTIIQWISNYAKNNNGVLTQVNEKVLVDVIQTYNLDNVSELVRSFIKPNWTNSIEKIQRTVITLASEYASRLLEELKKIDTKALLPHSEWLENIVLQMLNDQTVVGPLLRDAAMASCLKNIAKVCSFLHPVKKNITVYKKMSPPSEWLRKSSHLIQFLRDRLYKHSLTMGEVASYLELTLTVGDTNEMRLIFSTFQDKHSCSETNDAPTSAKVVQEISVLLDSFANPNLNLQKCVMMEAARQLCCHETLSWLICTECAKKMPTGWASVWLSLAKAGLTETLAQLNLATITQFRLWLQELSLKNSDDYMRLMKCMRSFMQTLTNVWQQCRIPLEDCRMLLLNASKAIKDPQLQRDFSLLVQELINAEFEKQRPKVPKEAPVVVDEARRPPNDIQSRLAAPAVVIAPDYRHPQPVLQQPVLQRSPPPRPVQSEPAPPQQIVSPPPKEPEQPQSISSPPRPPASVPKPPKKAPLPAPTSEATPMDTEPQKIPAKVPAVMSTNALFKRSSPSKAPLKSSPEKVTPPRPPKEQPQPFSPTNPTRTKVCQNCKAMISCASFKCPKCQKSTRTVQPVTCPDCGQENHELKGYACQFCYRSLLPVLFGGGEEARPAEPPKSAPDVKRKKRPKKKSVEKKRSASRTDEEQTSATETAHESDGLEPPAKRISRDNQERVQPLKVKISQGNRGDVKVHETQGHDEGHQGHTSGVKFRAGQGHRSDLKGRPDKGHHEGRPGRSPPVQGSGHGIKGRSSLEHGNQNLGRSHSNQGQGHSDHDQGHSDQAQGRAGCSLTDSSDSDSADDFRPQPPPKKRKKQVLPIILKRNTSATTTLSEDESDDDGGNALIISSEAPVAEQSSGRKESRDLTMKIKIAPRISSDDKSSENGKIRRVSSQGSKTYTNDPDVGHIAAKTSIPQPHFYNRPPPVTNENSSPQRPGLKVTLAQATQPQAAMTKRRVGHSSTMSKKQKNILSRMKKIGTVSTKGTKTTPPNAHPTQKELMRSPMQNKRPSYENGALSSPNRNSVDLIRHGERQRHDSSCSTSSVGSPSRALSFTLASVEKSPLQKLKSSPNRPRNIGVRSGGPPTSKKHEANREIRSGEGPSHLKKTLFPQPLNSNQTDSSEGQKRKKKHKKRKEHAQKMISQKKYDSLVAKRKPGPASKTGYRHLLKMAHRLKKQKAMPHRRWHLPTHVKVPRHVNLSRYAVVSLALFPRNKLARIQSLVPNYKLHNLYA